MQIFREGSKFTALYDSVDLGLSVSSFAKGNQMAPGSMNIDFLTEPGVIKPTLRLQRDLGDPGTNSAIAAIKASNGTIYFLDTKAGKIAVESAALGSSTVLTLVDDDVGLAAGNAGTVFIEFQNFLFAKGDATNMLKFGDITGSPTITLFTPSGLTGLGQDFLATKSFLYWLNKNNVGRSSDPSTHNATALALDTAARPQSLAPYGDYVLVGSAILNEGGYSFLNKWDGVSTIIDGQAIVIPDTGLKVIRNVGGVILIFCVSNPQGSAISNILRVYRWTGGTEVEKILEIDLVATLTNSFSIDPGAVDVKEGKAFFGLDAGSSTVMTIDNGIYTLDKNGILNLEYVSDADTSDTTDIAIFFVKWVADQLFTLHTNGANRRFSHFPALTYSSNGILNFPATRFHPLYKTRIDRVRFPVKTLPASTSVTLKEKTDQASSFTTVKAFSTTNTKLCKVEGENEYAFQPANIHQLQLALASSGSSKPEILLPIAVEGTVLDDQN